jgi:hypothetical protein
MGRGREDRTYEVEAELEGTEGGSCNEEDEVEGCGACTLT